MGKGVKGEVGEEEIGIIFFKKKFMLNVHIQIFNIKFRSKKHIPRKNFFSPPPTQDDLGLRC